MLCTLGDLVLGGTTLRRPKPLLLLAFLALEGAKSRRYLAELFFGDTKDPNDSLSTALKYLKQHPASALYVQPKTVFTEVTCDVQTVFDALSEGRVSDAVAHYRGPFLATLDLTLGEELEDWVYSRQDSVAQRLRNALLDYADARGGSGAKLAEQAWSLTKDQGMDAEALNRLYRLLNLGSSPLAREVRRFAGEYGLPLNSPRVSAGPATLAPAGTSGTPGSSTLPLQVQDLGDRLEELRYSEGGLALCLWGEAGIGKSWTLAKVRGALSFPSCVVAAALPARLTPYHLPRAASLPQWTRTVMSRLAAAEPVRPEDAADAIGVVLAASAPVMLQLEDLHDALPERVDFWTLVARVVARSPGVALVATSRRPPTEAFTAERLSALSPESAAHLLEREAASGLPAETAAWVYARAAGNPLFTLEFFRYLRRSGSLWHDGRAWRWRAPEESHLPATIEALVSESMHAVPLGVSAQLFVDLKALLPSTIPREVLLRVTGLSSNEVGMAEQALVARGILRDHDSGNHDFVHPLYREALVQGLAPARHQRLAKQIVAALAEHDPETAAVFAADAALPDRAALSLLGRAATVAAGQGRRVRAGELLATAADHAEGDEAHCLRLQAAGHLRKIQPRRARDLAERVLAAEPENVEALLLFATCLTLLGEGGRAEALLSRTRLPDFAQQGVFELLVRLRTERHDYPGAVATWGGQPERQSVARPESKSQAAFALAHLGRFAEADKLVRTSLQADISFEERAGLLETGGVIAYYTGDMAAGLECFDTSVAILRATQDPNVAPRLMRVLRLRATTYWAFFRQADAIRDTEEAMNIAGELGRGRDYAIAQTYLGIPLTELGEYARAEEALLESREVLRRADAREHLAACEAVLGGVYLNWQLPGMITRALGHTRASLRISEDIGAPVLVSQSSFYVAWAELIAGQAEASESHANRGLAVALELGQRRFASVSYWIRALAREQLGQLADAVADLDAAALLAEGMALEGHRLLFLIDRDRLLDDREAVKRHLIAARPYNVTGFRLPARQQYIETLEPETEAGHAEVTWKQRFASRPPTVE